MKATVFDIYKGTTHDGPGIRDTVFLKGCPLRCIWCQNPEGIEFKNAVWYEQRFCIGCGECVEACNSHALMPSKNGIHINYSLCKNCYSCTEACPTQAIEKIASEYTVDELSAEILKDMEYFKSSGGGVTVSGGEAMSQGEFVKAFFKEMKKNGISTALDTSGYCDVNALKEVLKYTDILLYDLKILDQNLHRKWTGVDNQKIIDNILSIKEKMKQKTLWIRTPLIPNYTATRKNISELAQFINDNLKDCVDKWELCTFNALCVKKYEKLNCLWEFRDVELLSDKQTEDLLCVAEKSGVKNVVCSGMTRKQV